MAETWTAKWIALAYDPREDLGVLAYRNRFHLDNVPAHASIRVSADNRYKLFVNGHMVSFGPQRGDSAHWFYETLDIAPYLKEGDNLIWALVWAFGWMAPMAQMAVRSGFVFESEIEGLSTPGKWEAARVKSWDFAMMHSGMEHFYIDIGPGEIWDGRSFPDWQQIPVEDLGWKPPHVIRTAAPRGATWEPHWGLVPRSIPPMRYHLRKGWPQVCRGGFMLPGGRELLLDYGELLCAFPQIAFEGPEGAEVTITYAESLWGADGEKGNRNDVEDKEMRGYEDKVILGRGTTEFEPLWWRTYRYLSIRATADVRVKIDAVETGYPYEVESSFEADDPRVKPIWNVAVRTAERCAGENYFDCPYYEQLQYAGDTRIQALIHYYLSTDRALTRNAVDQFGWSLMENGMTQSRYPNRVTQIIPPFCLWWLMMIHDQVLYDGRYAHPQADGILEGVAACRERGDNWWFADWVDDWSGGIPPGGSKSLVHDLTFTLARFSLRMARCSGSDLEYLASVRAIQAEMAEYLKSRYEVVQGLLDAPAGIVRHPCEHVESLYRVGQQMAGVDVDAWPVEALRAAGAAETTFYFSFYKHQAMAATDYMDQLRPWTEMIENGLTTFAEKPEPTRSDCHAWSAHPILGFFQLVAGVKSVAPSWGRVLIQPQPGSLRRFDARIAHPAGELGVLYEDDRLTVETPVPAELVWRGERATLAPGTHRIASLL